MPEEKNSLETTMQIINKKHGPNSVMFLGTGSVVKVPVISTGCLSLDRAIGVGGIPKGRITEIFGPPSGGKTTTCLHIAAQCQKAGGTVAIVDAEHALDPSYSQALGVRLDDLIVSQPDCGEDALEIVGSLVGAVDCIIVDSVAALVPRKELDGEMGDAVVGLHARLMSQAMRKLTGIVAKSHCCLIFINQTRDAMGQTGFGGQQTVTTGGKALKFYCSLRLEVKHIGQLKDGDTVTGSRTQIKVVKNKLAPPFKIAEFDLVYGKGICREGDLIDLGLEHKVLEKSGNWISYNSERLGNGREKTKEFLRLNSDVGNKLEDSIKTQIGMGMPPLEVVN